MDDNSNQDNSQTPAQPFVSNIPPMTSDTATLDTPLPAPSVPPPAPVEDNPEPSEPISPEFREQVYKDLAEAMLDGLGTGEIEVKASEDSSEYILPKLDSVQTKEDLIVLLENVSIQWPVYKKIYDKYKTVQTVIKQDGEDKQKIEDIQSQLHSLTNTTKPLNGSGGAGATILNSEIH